nr:uncharacterized protein LOC116820283 [Chelonoidis abingdonii]
MLFLVQSERLLSRNHQGLLLRGSVLVSIQIFHRVLLSLQVSGLAFLVLEARGIAELQLSEDDPAFTPFNAGRLVRDAQREMDHYMLRDQVVVGEGTWEQQEQHLVKTQSRGQALGEWQWLSNSLSLLPPCAGAVNFYSQYGRDATFTDTEVGRPFRSLHTHHLQLLEWQGRPHKVFSVQGEHAKHYHLILPSFFHLLQTLHRERRHFAVVFRTFGTDLPRILHAVHCALEGQHPQFPALQDLTLPVELTAGRICCSRREVVLSRGPERISTRDDGRKLYSYFSSLQGLGGFQDHFDWWARNQFSSRGGKPLWIDPHDSTVHHIFIDDNIRLNDSDTIICPQVFSERGGSCARPAPTSELYDVCLVQTNLLEAIADESYFLRCVRRCEENYERYLASAKSQLCDAE